jgi:3-oxoacyl-[acyl-carrier-protein] synthase-3
MERTGWRYEDLDVVFCHQPTKNAVVQLGDATEAARKLWSTAERFGNTSTCSIPLAMAEALEAGILVPGAKVLVLAPSAGISAAAVTLVW